MVQNLALETVPVTEVGVLTSACRRRMRNAHVTDEAAYQIMRSVVDSDFFDDYVVKGVGGCNKASMLCMCESIGKSDGMQTYPILYNKSICVAGGVTERDMRESVRLRKGGAVTHFLMMGFDAPNVDLLNENILKDNCKTKTRVERRTLTMLKKITARHFDLSAEMKKRAEGEMDRLNRYFDNIVSAELVLDTERHRHLAELRVNVYNNMITATGETDDMYNSIAVAVDKVKAQLKKYKGKLKHKKPEEITETIDTLTRPNTDVDEVEV
jgi:ribosomal subunit interface protein